MGSDLISRQMVSGLSEIVGHPVGVRELPGCMCESPPPNLTHTLALGDGNSSF